MDLERPLGPAGEISGGDGCCAEAVAASIARAKALVASVAPRRRLLVIASLLIYCCYICWKPGRPMKGFATASFPSAIFNGNAGRRRGAGPLSTLAASFGS